MDHSISATSCDAEVIELLKLILGHHMLSQVTDIHIRSDNTVRARSRGVLAPATNWEGFTDSSGRLAEGQSYASIAERLIGTSPADEGSRVFRTKTLQVRVQPVFAVNNIRKLFIRVQPLTPPPLTALLKEHPKVIDHLANASGLVLVCGPIGSGKTTTAASIVSHWSNRRSKHVLCLEDPVEYLLTPINGDVTPISCNLGDAGRLGDLPGLADELRRAVRYDIDGLFIGEVRNSAMRSACLGHAATREPVVTTIHAGGISDAVLRLTEPEPGGVEQSALRVSLAQCLHSILYVDMAFTESGDLVPVIVSLPGKLPAVRNAIAGGDARTLGNSLNVVLQSVSEDEVGISPTRAKEVARAAGATEKSVNEALPPDAR